MAPIEQPPDKENVSDDNTVIDPVIDYAIFLFYSKIRKLIAYLQKKCFFTQFCVFLCENLRFILYVKQLLIKNFKQ